MQELEKILEEIKESSIMVATSKEHYIHPQDGRFVEEVVLLDCVEEIIRKHMNNGWISVEERLPEDGTYLCTLAGELCGIEEPFTGMCGIENGIWDEPDCVIAWRPLPEPYRPERSDNHDGE